MPPRESTPCPANGGGRAHARRQAGFTLIEILIVVTLVAALSAVLIATIGGGMDGLRLRGTAKDIAGELRHARAQAMAKGEVQRFVIDPKERRWSSGATSQQGSNQASDESRGEGRSETSGETSGETREGEVSKKIDIVFIGARELQPRRGQGAIVFFEDGASSGGRIQLRQDKAAWNIDVAWLTGEVSLHRARVEGTRAAAVDDAQERAP